MSEFVEVKAAELTGAALDWAVAKALGFECGYLSGKLPSVGCNTPDGRQLVIGPLHNASMIEEIKTGRWRPSTDWAQGGAMLEKFSELIDGYLFDVAERDDCKCDELVFNEHYRPFYSEISLPKICRAIVSAKLGDVVQVPVELVGVAS